MCGHGGLDYSLRKLKDFENSELPDFENSQPPGSLDVSVHVYNQDDASKQAHISRKRDNASMN